MAKLIDTPFPRLIEMPDGRHAVEIAPDVTVVWWKCGDRWFLNMEGRFDVRDVKITENAMAVH
jgi:hypothetical protein